MILIVYRLLYNSLTLLITHQINMCCTLPILPTIFKDIYTDRAVLLLVITTHQYDLHTFNSMNTIQSGQFYWLLIVYSDIDLWKWRIIRVYLWISTWTVSAYSVKFFWLFFNSFPLHTSSYNLEKYGVHVLRKSF